VTADEGVERMGRLADALRRKYSSPEACMRALGLDPALLRETDDEKPLPPLGTGGRDRAGVIAVFEGDPMPPPSGPGYSQVVVVSRGTPKPTGSGDVTSMPAMAFDAMPPELTRFPAGKAFERLTVFFGRYSRGEFPRFNQ
jgi:hypothetical protein